MKIRNWYLERVLREFKEEGVSKKLQKEAKKYAEDRLNDGKPAREDAMGIVDEGIFALAMRAFVDGRLGKKA